MSIFFRLTILVISHLLSLITFLLHRELKTNNTKYYYLSPTQKLITPYQSTDSHESLRTNDRIGHATPSSR